MAEERASGDVSDVMTRLTEAAAQGDAGAVVAILDAEPALLDALGGEGSRTALHRAAYGGHDGIVDLLLRRGANPNVRDVGDNALPIHFAAEKGSLTIVRRLLDHGSDVHGFGDLHGIDVIGWATCFGGEVHREVAAELLARGAKHNIFSAVALGDVAAIGALAAISRDVADKPMAIWEERRRPLHLAVLKKRPDSIEALLAIGADTEATNIDGLTALDQAALAGEQACVEVLLAHGARIHLPAAFGLRRRDVVERLLHEDPRALAPGGRWDWLLHLATEGDVVENLIRHGAGVDHPHDSKAFGTKSYTPLHSAAWSNSLQAIRVLVAHGAALDAKDGTYDATPLGWAEYGGKKAAAELLRSLGAI